MMKSISTKNLLAAAALLCASICLAFPGCASSDAVDQGALPAAAKESTGGAGGQAANGKADGPGICLMNNCHSDRECSSCDDERTTCLIGDGRCAACDPETKKGCQEGFTCTSFGLCAPAGQSCDTDEHGEPTAACQQDTDCLACSPMNQICDPKRKRCTACTATNTMHCLRSDICVKGKCSPKCPKTCGANADCSQCGVQGKEAHACNAHVCSECSATFPCTKGLECVAGNCIPGCGLPGAGKASGDCMKDADCAPCGDPKAPKKWECKKAVNANGANDHGACAPPAEGCADLGVGVAVMPKPWDAITNACSKDSNCYGIGIKLNVGEAIRDLIGSDKIDLGFKKVKIQDAFVSYNMSKCASIPISNNIDCGICVPCAEDSDCMPIDIDGLISDLFKGDILVQMATSFLLDELYGDNPNHDLNFYCQPVAKGYGVCAPCSNPLQACGQNQGSSNSGSCSHDECNTGGPLAAECGQCVDDVCYYDPYCCSDAWDPTCLDEVAQYCGATYCSGGTCSHSECQTGEALDPACSSCAKAICDDDPWCCDEANEWDSYCVGSVGDFCGANTCTGGANVGGCGHSECTTGSQLNSSCSDCAGDVCTEDDYCCNTTWDDTCVDIAVTWPSCAC